MNGCTRRTFNLIVGAAAVELWACGTSRPTLAPNSSNQVTLTYAQFPSLMSTGGSAVVDVQGQFPLAVVRTADATATALSATCTHAGCIVDYDGAAKALHCPCHNADFDLQGNVLRGPTSIPLPVYKATPAADGIVVDLS